VSSDVLTWLALLELLGRPSEKPKPAPSGPPGPPGPPGSGTTPPPLPGPAPAPAPVPVAPLVPPGTLPPMPPWPAPPVPGTLPPFPGPSWCPDTPLSDPVTTRAAYWNPQLWDYTSQTIRRPFVQEQFGGQWLSFQAAWHPGAKGAKTYMATEAWRLCTAPPVAPPTPAPVPPAPGPAPAPAQRPPPVGPEPASGAWQSNAAFIARYQSALTYLARTVSPPQPSWDPGAIDGKFGPHTSAAVKAYQSAHGLTVDGECGNQTAASLDSAMGYAPSTPAPAPSPSATPSAPSAMPAGPPGLVGPYPGSGAWQTNTQYIARYQSALTWLSATSGIAAWNPGAVDGKFGPKTQAAVRAFQAAHGLTADGEAGAATGAALDAALQNPPQAS
jgi:peptidoglycan hydrolase-like protein with peptidoglycan-binding domain